MGVIRKFTSRRFLLALGAGVVCTVLVWFGKIDGAVFASVVIATVAAYITGNTVQKVRGGVAPTP